jgi:predicted aspartyl protease
VSYRWCAKGERFGELHRNEVLADSAADFVCYLSDDDLWTPSHLESMYDALRSADLAHTNHHYVDDGPDGDVVGVGAIDLADPRVRHEYLAGRSYLCLSTMGHTMEAVRSKGLRWHLTPGDRYTDWYFFSRAIEQGLTVAHTDRITVCKFAGAIRKTWSLERRYDELARWRDVIDTSWAQYTVSAMLDQTRLHWSDRLAFEAATSAESTAREAHHRAELNGARSAAGHLEAQLQVAGRQIADTDAELIAVRHELDRAGQVAAQERLELNDRIEQMTHELDRERAALAAADERYRVLAATKLARLQQRLARSSVIRRIAGNR